MRTASSDSPVHLRVIRRCRAGKRRPGDVILGRSIGVGTFGTITTATLRWAGRNHAVAIKRFKTAADFEPDSFNTVAKTGVFDDSIAIRTLAGTLRAHSQREPVLIMPVARPLCANVPNLCAARAALALPAKLFALGLSAVDIKPENMLRFKPGTIVLCDGDGIRALDDGYYYGSYMPMVMNPPIWRDGHCPDAVEAILLKPAVQRLLTRWAAVATAFKLSVAPRADPDTLWVRRGWYASRATAVLGAPAAEELASLLGAVERGAHALLARLRRASAV